MGWGSGTYVMSEVIEAVGGGTNTRKERVDFYIKMIKTLEQLDADNLYECLDQDDCFDEAFNRLHPEIENY
jgi:hypothetical protein